MTEAAWQAPPVEGDLEQLRDPALENLGLLTLAISWLWFVARGVRLINDYPMTFGPIWPAVILCVAPAVLLIPKRVSLDWRSLYFLAMVSASLVAGYAHAPNLAWLYGQSMIVGLAGLLTGTRGSFVAATVLSAVCLGANAAWGAPPASSAELWPVIGLIWGSALTAGLTSRNLYTALDWAMHSQQQAWQAATDARQRRGELRRAHDSLRLNVELLERTSHELDLARLQAEEARRIKARFVANISHELRTPLNIIVGFAETLCTSPDSYGRMEWPPALREDLLSIWRNAEHLLKMIDDVLDLAQIEAGRLPILPGETDLAHLIRDTLVAASPLFRDSRLELRVSLPQHMPTLQLDQTRIRQVLLNLINNAVRFTHEGSIEVGATLDDEQVTVYVRDTGEGIPEDKLSLIFQEFEQVDTAVRRPMRGAGLGLAISRHFVRLHGGQIWAESSLGRGSTFYFTLPRPRLGASTHYYDLVLTPSARRQPEERAKTVIALSQDARTTRTLERHLDGLRVLPAQSVVEAASLLREHHPAAVMIASPSEEPIAARNQARELLDAIAPFDLPVISCSMFVDTQSSLAMQVSHFLVKPITRREIVAAIRAVHDAPQHVLVVDDEPDMARLLRRLIKQEWPTIEVSAAMSGQEALTCMARHPDVVLLDLGLPDMSGADVLETLRGQEDTAGIPVIVVTASNGAANPMVEEKGELYLAKNSRFTREEVARLLELFTQALPPHYVVNGPTPAPGIPRAAPA